MASTYTNSLQISSKNDDIIARKILTNEGEALVEFVDTEILGLQLIKPNVLHYFEGNSELEVERHFEKAFFSSMADGRQVESSSLPMRERKLPASFWRQDRTSSVHMLGQKTDLQSHTNVHHLTTIGYPHTTGLQNIYTTATHYQAPYSFRYTETVSFQAPVTSRLISYAKLPVSVMSAHAPNVKLTHTQINDRPRCSLADTTAVYYTCGPTTGHGFNPRYNFLLVQPDIRPELPLVYGQRRGHGNKKG
ncbi:hypothetical protein QZH41_009232 [Actinostola sp. cb2023]|nr:hypothetical protein QZH41_009232 [Actinostola sp. cb2023]